MNRLSSILSFCVALLFLTPGESVLAAPSADKIIDKMVKQDPLGYGGAEATLSMNLVNKRKQKKARKFILYSRTDGDNRRTFVRFLSPADIQGTTFLGLQINSKRRQYLFLPALDKIRRISGADRNSAFVGSDFSYADMDLRDVDNSSKELLGDGKVRGKECFKVKVTPKSPQSAYGKVVVWVNKKTYLPMRMRFYNKKGGEIKRLIIAAEKKVQGRWIITISKMVDLKRNHTTIIQVKKIALKSNIPLAQFKPRALKQ